MGIVVVETMDMMGRGDDGGHRREAETPLSLGLTLIWAGTALSV